MAYSDFTVETLQTKLGISLREVSNSFESVTAISPSQPLVAMLERGMPVVLGANKEKARSEWLIAPLLLEVREVRLRQISVFSGSDFKVDPKQGLSGFCDFLISRSPLQMAVESPVVAIVEAKHEDLNAGIPQCLAAMYAARLFNEKRGKSLVPSTARRLREPSGAFCGLQGCKPSPISLSTIFTRSGKS